MTRLGVTLRLADKTRGCCSFSGRESKSEQDRAVVDDTELRNSPLISHTNILQSEKQKLTSFIIQLKKSKYEDFFKIPGASLEELASKTTPLVHDDSRDRCSRPPLCHPRGHQRTDWPTFVCGTNHKKSRNLWGTYWINWQRKIALVNHIWLMIDWYIKKLPWSILYI